MWTTIVTKFLTLLMPLVMLFNTGAVMQPSLSAADAVQITYDFDNDKAYSAAGTVTLKAEKDGEYDLYWGDGAGEVLAEKIGDYTVRFSEFATVSVDDGTGEKEIQEFTVIPDGAEKVMAFKNKRLVGQADLPDEKSGNEGEPSYLYGALSDVHFHRYYGHLGDDAKLTLPNSLNFLDLAGVSLVALSGDLTNSGEESSLALFNEYTSKYDFPVYTCMGNHDTRGDSVENGAWEKYINPGVYTDILPQGVSDVSGRDFVYTPDGKDVFIFLSQYQWSYNSEDSEILTPDQLDWFERELEKYKDRTVYLFFHTFLPNMETGDQRTGEGNALSDKGACYDLVYTPGTADEIRFSELLKEYKNVIFFNGHSHYTFDMQEMNPVMNITDYDGETCTMVHIPSVSSPRKMEADSAGSSERYMRESQGYLVKVYDDRIVLQGVEFLRGLFLSYACYVIER